MSRVHTQILPPPPGVTTHYKYYDRLVLNENTNYRIIDGTVIGEGGILKSTEAKIMLSGGSLTTNNKYLSIISSAKTGNLNVNTKIIDYHSSRIGVRVIGRGSNTDDTSEVLLNSAGGYTGDTIVEKGGRLIVLNGTSQSRKFIVDNGRLFSDASGDFRPDASIHLTKSGEFNFALRSATQKLASLNVSGSGVLGFGIESKTMWASTNANRHLFLDDLVINSGSELIIKNWKEGAHRLFVRKNSAHLKESLGRIKYDENLQWRAQVRDYDKDYWEICAPEPSMYGAVSGMLGLGLVVWRRRRDALLRFHV